MCEREMRREMRIFSDLYGSATVAEEWTGVDCAGRSCVQFNLRDLLLSLSLKRDTNVRLEERFVVTAHVRF